MGREKIIRDIYQKKALLSNQIRVLLYENVRN